MTNTYRAMCAELADAAEQARQALEGWANYGQWVWPESALEQAKRNTTEALAALNAIDRCPLGPPKPQPVAVSERLPGPDDCDEQGRCWWFTPKEGNTEPFRCADWSFYAGWRQKYTHWLPANALPTPETTNG